MKRLLIFIAALFLFFCCSDEENNKTNADEISACGVKNPQENLLWLAELINKAEHDSIGNYQGSIWLFRYKNTGFFVTDMALESGGIAYYSFDCDGNYANYLFEDSQEFANIVANEPKYLIYTNIKIDE